jgi:hypothetical protein
MTMITERLQVLMSRAQRRRLEDEAKRRRTSVGAIIREAIDARVTPVPTERRLRAVAEIGSMEGGRFLSPAALERLVEEEREQEFARPARRGRA